MRFTARKFETWKRTGPDSAPGKNRSRRQSRVFAGEKWSASTKFGTTSMSTCSGRPSRSNASRRRKSEGTVTPSAAAMLNAVTSR